MVQGDISTIAKDDQSLTLPTLVAPEIAAETIRVLLDEDDSPTVRAGRSRNDSATRTPRSFDASCRGSAPQTGRYS
jgi:hypothetical protein